MVEFISYDGKYPRLCGGTLVVRVNCKEYQLKSVLKSGGEWCNKGLDTYIKKAYELGKLDANKNLQGGQIHDRYSEEY